MASYRNLAEAHRHQSETLGDRAAVRHKRDGRYQDLSWSDYRKAVVECAAALIEVGLKPGDRVGLLAENRVEWLLADLGILSAAAVTVSPHSSLSARQVQYQMHDAGARWLFVSTPAQLQKVLSIRGELSELRGIVAFDLSSSADGAMAWPDFLATGKKCLARHEIARREESLGPDDLATIMYTSGTTGEPKGVMLSHNNVISNVVACLEICPLLPDDLPLCWLPLSHIYARTIDFYENIIAGTTICLAESAETVIANIAETQPTHLSCVPRFYEKVLAAVASPDPAVTQAKLHAVFGKRMKFLGAGGAPLPPNIEKVLLAAKLPIYPGYGLTESAPVISFNSKDRQKPFTVGPAIPGVEVKIAPDGEVLARGPNIMKGYWNKPEDTAEAVRDGWLYTGDLGSIDADGFLSITGRKKELLVLSNGKKVIPSQVEGLILADDCIDQAVVYGEGRTFLSALVVPRWENLKQALGSASTGGASNEILSKERSVVEFLHKRVVASLVDLAGYEQVKKILVLPQPFTVAADELTVSLKLRRNIIIARYQAELDALYREG